MEGEKGFNPNVDPYPKTTKEHKEQAYTDLTPAEDKERYDKKKRKEAEEWATREKGLDAEHKKISEKVEKKFLEKHPIGSAIDLKQFMSRGDKGKADNAWQAVLDNANSIEPHDGDEDVSFVGSFEIASEVQDLLSSTQEGTVTDVQYTDYDGNGHKIEMTVTIDDKEVKYTEEFSEYVGGNGIVRVELVN